MIGNKIELELAGNDTLSFFVQLTLPAEPWEMEDALQQARLIKKIDISPYIYSIKCPQLPALEHVRINDASLVELNWFAERLNQLKDDEKTALKGIFGREWGAGHYDQGIAMTDLMNLTYDLEKVPVLSIDSDYKLGEFVIQNQLDETIAGISDEPHKYRDKKALGRNYRLKNQGEFVDEKYVGVGTYSFSKRYTRPNKEQLEVHNTVAFRLGIMAIKGNFISEEDIYLPLDIHEVKRIAKRHKVKSIEDCMLRHIDSAIKGIGMLMILNMKNFNKLNRIAQEYVNLSEVDKVKLKAVIQKTEPKSLDEVKKLIDDLDWYDFSYYDANSEEFAERYLTYHLPTNFDTGYLMDLDTRRFGNQLLRRLGADTTNYGVISAKNVPLVSLVPYDETEQLNRLEEETIGGMEL